MTNIVTGMEFTLWDNQVRGTYGNYPHWAIPGRYFVTGFDDYGRAVILRSDHEAARPFVCGCSALAAAFCEPWSNVVFPIKGGD